VAWRRIAAEAFVQGAVLVDAVLRPDSDAVAYLLTYVSSDRERWAALRIGSPGPVRVWLDGIESYANDVVRPAWPDQDAAPVHLKRGANPLLIKTVITHGPWRMFVRLTDLDGRRLAGVTASADVPSPGRFSSTPPVHGHHERGATARSQPRNGPPVVRPVPRAWNRRLV
jgi:hypothetical protein